MSVNTLMIIGIVIVVLCSFGFLADMILANWRAMSKTKAAPFSKLNRSGLLHWQRPTLDCFGVCMKKYAWDVEEVSLCASKCAA